MDATVNIETIRFIQRHGVPSAKRVEHVVASGDSGDAYEIDCAAATIHEITLTDDCILTIANAPSGGFAITIDLIQDGTGGHTVTWPVNVTWPGGTAPTLTADADAVDAFRLYTPDGGTTWRGSTIGLDFA